MTNFINQLFQYHSVTERDEVEPPEIDDEAN